MTYPFENNLSKLNQENPFNYDLGIKIIKCKIPGDEVTICCHGYGSNNAIADVINSHDNFSGHLIGFNFPDYNINSKIDHKKSVYGTPREILPLIYILKRCICDLKLGPINLYGFSAGGGVIINALSALMHSNYDQLLKKINILPEHKKAILTALENGVVILDCPLKSIGEIITLRGTNKELEILQHNYKKNNMDPIEVLNSLNGIDLDIFLNFQNGDEILSNRDDQLFIDRLSKINQGKTIVSTSFDKGHNAYHKALWQSYNDFKKNEKSHEPFSFDEVLSIKDFPLQKPEFIKSEDQIDLAYYEFLPKNGFEDIVIFYHGAGLYINKTYQFIGEKLKNKFDIAAYMIDMRGHGHSQGNRGDAPNVELMFRDIDNIINFVNQKFPDKKIYLAGHSAGAGLLVNYNSWKIKNGHKLNKQISGYIFIAPFLGPKSDANKIRAEKKFVKKIRQWVYFFNFLSGGFLFGNTKTIFFNYPDSILKSDPLILKYYTCNMSLATSPYDSTLLFQNFTVPIAIYVGSEDEEFLADKVIEYKNYATKVNKYSIAKIIPHLKHLSILIESASLINDAIKDWNKKS